MCGCDAFQVCGDLQSTVGHQGGPTGHHHLGHSDWAEEERFPLRELCTLAHIQVSTLVLLCPFLSPLPPSHICCCFTNWIYYNGTFVNNRWSHDGKFFARMTTDTLSIYETPVSRLQKYSCIYFKCECDNKSTFLLLSVYGPARQEESQDYRDQVGVLAFMILFLVIACLKLWQLFRDIN